MLYHSRWNLLFLCFCTLACTAIRQACIILSSLLSLGSLHEEVLRCVAAGSGLSAGKHPQPAEDIVKVFAIFQILSFGPRRQFCYPHIHHLKLFAHSY